MGEAFGKRCRHTVEVERLGDGVEGVEGDCPAWLRQDRLAVQRCRDLKRLADLFGVQNEILSW